MNSACSTCMESFTSRCNISTIPCGHVFHTLCIENWLSNGRNRCSQCRRICNKDQITKLYFSEASSENNLILELEEENLKLKEDANESKRQVLKLEEEKLKLEQENLKCKEDANNYQGRRQHGCSGCICTRQFWATGAKHPSCEIYSKKSQRIIEKLMQKSS